MINYLVQNNWKWNQCSLPIKRYVKRPPKDGQEEYMFQIVNCEESGDSNENKIKIIMDKPFPFEQGTGFIWHKSWNLPEITFDLSLEELEYLSAEYKELGCEVMAVYPVKNGSSYFLNEVTLEGANVKKINEQSITFKYLKFGQTSFNHNRNRFCLLLWVYAENSFGDRDDVFCFISSPIYVDSRKEARKKVSNGSATGLVSPKKFLLPVGGVKGSVQNTSDAFLRYYTAPSIRGKIKHPIYISYHFDKIFKAYLNTELNLTLAEALETFNSDSKQKSSIFLLIVREGDQKQRKKILTVLEKWKFNLIEYGHPDDGVSQKWKPIDKDQISLAYSHFYDSDRLKTVGDANGEMNEDQMEFFSNQQGLANGHVVSLFKNNGNEVQGSNAIQQQQKASTVNLKNAARNYELSTMIVLSKPKKKVKRQDPAHARHQNSEVMVRRNHQQKTQYHQHQQHQQQQHQHQQQEYQEYQEQQQQMHIQQQLNQLNKMRIMLDTHQQQSSLRNPQGLYHHQYQPQNPPTFNHSNLPNYAISRHGTMSQQGDHHTHKQARNRSMSPEGSATGDKKNKSI